MAARSESESRTSAVCQPASARPAVGAASPAPCTALPRAASAVARCAPTKPSAPVMKTVAELSGVLLEPVMRSPVLQHVGERLLERNHGLPARGLRELAAVAEQDRHVARAKAGGVLADLDLLLRHPQQSVEHILDAPRLAAADVVDLTRLALLERQPVRLHHVAHVGEVALRL